MITQKLQWTEVSTVVSFISFPFAYLHAHMSLRKYVVQGRYERESKAVRGSSNTRDRETRSVKARASGRGG